MLFIPDWASAEFDFISNVKSSLSFYKYFRDSKFDWEIFDFDWEIYHNLVCVLEPENVEQELVNFGLWRELFGDPFQLLVVA